jgi:hypothetical protein
MTLPYRLRIGRPSTDLAKTEAMYRHGLGLVVVGRFADHDGFDGVMLAHKDANYHFEFTRHRQRPVLPTPTHDDLVVLYVPEFAEWERMCSSMDAAGFERTAAFNPYWERCGRTYRDHDGYRIVLWNGSWDEAGE